MHWKKIPGINSGNPRDQKKQTPNKIMEFATPNNNEEGR
jgi:hypothetical protein